MCKATRPTNHSPSFSLSLSLSLCYTHKIIHKNIYYYLLEKFTFNGVKATLKSLRARNHRIKLQCNQTTYLTLFNHLDTSRLFFVFSKKRKKEKIKNICSVVVQRKSEKQSAGTEHVTSYQE